MPKDATKNIDRYKIKGGQLNEFDFQRRQEDFAEASNTEDNLIPGTPPEKRDLGALPFHGKLIKKATKTVKGTRKSPVKPTAKAASAVKATAKKSATTTKAAKASKTAKSSKTTKTRLRGATAKKLAARKAAKK